MKISILILVYAFSFSPIQKSTAAAANPKIAMIGDIPFSRASEPNTSPQESSRHKSNRLESVAANSPENH
jgi:hypothetical protein